MIVVNQNTDTLTQGAWVDYGGSKFLIAHSSSLKFQRVFSRLQAPHRSKVEKGTLDPAISKEIVCQAFSKAIILDWKDVVDDKGVDVEFSSDMAFQALMCNTDLVEYIQEASTNLANFKAEELDNLGKA